jgi:exodeoxyribonuclease VII small subunit
MANEEYSFASTRARLDEIVTQVRRKDVSLEQSLDLLEEGVRLANASTELIDHSEWRAAAGEAEPELEHDDESTGPSGTPDAIAAEAPDSSDASGGSREVRADEAGLDDDDTQ